MNVQNELNAGENVDGTSQENATGSGFYGVCDYCNFYVSSRPDYEEVKKACDEHNAKNPGHDAAPVNN